MSVCNICTERCSRIKKCKKCNFRAGSTCIENWLNSHSNSCPGCRQNFLTGQPIAEIEIDYAGGLRFFAERIVENPPRNGHIFEDLQNIIKEIIIDLLR